MMVYSRMPFPTMQCISDMREAFIAAVQLRQAWWFTASSRTKARFSRTVIGGFWLGLSNALSIAILAVVYGTVFKVENFSYYVCYLGLGMAAWTLLASAINSSSTLFEANTNNILNTNTHPIYYTLEEWSFHIQTFSQSLLIIVLGLSFFQPMIIVNIFAYGLIPLLNLLLFSYWLPVIICLIGARYRDLYQLVPVLLQLIFLLTPIIYERKNLGDLQWLASINPIYSYINMFRSASLGVSIPINVNVIALLINFVGITLAFYMVAKSRKRLPFLL